MHDNQRDYDNNGVSKHTVGNIIRYSIIVLLLISLIICIVLLVSIYRKNKKEEEAYIVQGEVCIQQVQDSEELIAELDALPTPAPTAEPTPAPSLAPGQKPEPTVEPDTSQTKTPTKQLLEKKNEDIVGWIKINGTNINYPVVQTDNNSYYLDHNFKKQSSAAGAIFMYAENTFKDENISIYGHHMNNSKYSIMFSELVNYYDKDYAKSHSKIYFSDDYNNLQEYTVLLAMHIDKEKVKMNYLRQSFPSEAIFKAYMDQLKNNANMFLETTDYAYGDRFITLITCDRSQYGKNGRCIVVAVRKPTSEEVEQDTMEKPEYGLDYSS